MDDLVFFYPKGHEAHREPGHPERPERVETIRQAFEEVGWWEQYSCLEPILLPDEVLRGTHTGEFLTALERVCQRAQHFDLDTYTTPASWQLALNAAGGAAAIAEAVWQRRARRGFALTRPPGHHATQNQAMGFCLLNNVAVAAEYLERTQEAQRLAIVDVDLHHGNGTQDIFYQRADVFYFSTHQFPHYPGTGRLNETGAGSGKGYTANFPLPPFSGDKAFQTVIDELILPLLDRYSPEMILVSYGFDSHWRDPLGQLMLSATGYGDLVTRLANWADEHCGGRIALFLEGGYDLDAARACSLAVVAVLLGKEFKDHLGPAPRLEGEAWHRMVRQAKEMWGVLQ